MDNESGFKTRHRHGNATFDGNSCTVIWLVWLESNNALKSKGTIRELRLLRQCR